MQGPQQLAITAMGLAFVGSGCVLHRPYELVRIGADWNTERQVSLQAEQYSHLPLSSTRVRFLNWSYNVGGPLAPMMPQPEEPVSDTTLVPADAYPVLPPSPEADGPQPPSPTAPAPTPPPQRSNRPAPPRAARDGIEDLLDLARPPAVDSDSSRPNSANDAGKLGPTAATTPSQISQVGYTAPPPPKPTNKSWLFASPVPR